MRKSNWLIFIGLVFLIILLTFFIRLIPAFESIELKTLDWRFSLRGVQSVKDTPVVIVVIDDQSFESLPDRWPWPRSYYARVVNNLTRAGARVIGLDVIFDIPDRFGPEKDLELARAIKNSGRVVLTGKLEEHSQLGQVKRYVYRVPPIPILLEADSTWGIVGLQSDVDGIYRTYILGQPYRQKILPSFALQVLKKYYGIVGTSPLNVENNGLKLGEYFIPFFEPFSILVDFAGPAHTFPYYSFDTVIDDAGFQLKSDFDLDYFEELMADGVFKDKIVLIGSTVEEHHDNHPTPFLEYEDNKGNTVRTEMPGVEIHANAIRTILNQAYYHRMNWVIFVALLFILVALLQILTLRVPIIWSAVATLLIILLYNFAQFYLFNHARLVMEMATPTLAFFLTFVFSNLYQFIQEQREKRMIMGAFQHYVPEKVVQELLENPEKLTLGGEERFMTVLFSDVESFTSISEKMTPRQLVHLINDYLTEMTDIILKYDGIIDKYEGDAIMAEFGAPVYFEDHALRACQAALEMQSKLDHLAKKWHKEKKPVLRCRVGINSGNMIVGNMGSNKVFDYTVLGDEVNLASRLEGANKIFKTRIMISESTYHTVKDEMVTRPLDLIRVKGKEKPVQVFELLASKKDKIDDTFQNLLPVYLNGIRYYRQRNWKEAQECFEYCLRLRPNDGPSELYLKRVLEYAQHPPPPDWDGVFTLKSK